MKADVASYAVIVFDCDGVLLNSNALKTDAFFAASIPYGDTYANSLVEYHRENGGISRYKKFAYFFEEILKRPPEAREMERLLQTYAQTVRKTLSSCEIAEGIDELRAKTPKARWLVASGSDQGELREVLARRGIARFFDGGIYGSPATKSMILQEQLPPNEQGTPALFIGDSRHDCEVAGEFGLDFVFLDRWTDAVNFRDECLSTGITVKPDLKSLV